MIASEPLVRAAWSEVLGFPADDIDGTTDIRSFGNSMHHVRVILHLQEATGADLPLETLLECSTIAEMAAAIAEVTAA